MMTSILLHICVGVVCSYLAQGAPGVFISQEECHKKLFELYTERAPAGSIIDLEKSECTLIPTSPGRKI